MNWLCKLGLHDWKIIKLASTPQLKEDVRTELNCGIACTVHTMGYNYKEKKICRRCEKIIDTITPYKEKVRPYVQREMELEKKCSD